MKKYLITLLIIPTLIFADAVIFSGSDVKTLKPNIDLFGVAKILTTSTIPTAGLIAPKGSIAMYLTTGDLYLKTGALNTDWTKNQTGPVNLATDVTGILPIANGGTGSATQNFVDLTTAQNIAGLKNFTDALTITSNSANSLAVGPNGTTNPVFQVDSSTVSAATGVKITGAAAGTAPTIAAISSGANEDIAIASKGTGSVKLQVNSLNKYIASQYAHTFTSTAYLGANTVRFGVTGSSDTTLTASVEAPNAYFNFGQTRQHATGTLALQRDFRITPSTHSFVGASNLTNAAAFSIDGPSNGGTNATLASSSALYVPTSALTNVTNSYGLNVAATTGATNNYSAVFNGGSFGLGTYTPISLFHMLEDNSGTGNSNGLTIEQSGTGDALQHFVLSGVQRYTMGIDNSDSDKFKIGTNADLGTSNLFTMTNAGMVGIGTSSPNANAILDVVSTTKASMPFPRMTTAQKVAVASPSAGMVVYDTDMKGISYYNGTAWTTTNNKNVATKTANYTALQSDDVLLGDATSGAITITLPTAVGNTGEVFHIKKVDSSVNAVTIATTSSETIDGVTTQSIGVQYKNITVVSDGSNWSIL